MLLFLCSAHKSCSVCGTTNDWLTIPIIAEEWLGVSRECPTPRSASLWSFSAIRGKFADAYVLKIWFLVVEPNLVSRKFFREILVGNSRDVMLLESDVRYSLEGSRHSTIVRDIIATINTSIHVYVYLRLKMQINVEFLFSFFFFNVYFVALYLWRFLFYVVCSIQKVIIIKY